MTKFLSHSGLMVPVLIDFQYMRGIAATYDATGRRDERVHRRELLTSDYFLAEETAPRLNGGPTAIGSIQR